MSRTKVLVGVMFFVSLTVVWSLVRTGNKTQELPDYVAWESGSAEIPVLSNGREINLPVEIYQYTDFDKMSRDTVVIMRGADSKEWIALYTKELGENNGTDIVTKESKQYLYEKKDGRWVFVVDFSGTKSDATVLEFFKNNYNLEFIR